MFGDGRMQQADKINPAAVAELTRFLEACKERDIEVAAFLPPYALAVYEEIESREDRYPHILQLKAALDPVFETFGFQVFDFANIATFGSSDQEMKDSIHGFETALLRMMISMARENSPLREFADIPGMEGLLENAYSPRALQEPEGD